MTKPFLLALFSLIFYVGTRGQSPEKSSLLEVNYGNLVSRADLLYNKPVSRSEEGMPVGNGVMGSLVWTTPSALHFQLNRVDVFGNSSASNNFYERHTDYCGGIGFVDVEFPSGANDIFNDEFQQHLSCYDGLVSVKGKGVTARVLAWNEQDVMAVHINIHATPVLTNLRTLRQPVTKKGDHQALSTVSVAGNRIILKQEIREGTYYNGSVIVIEVTGGESSASVESPSMARLSASSSATGTTIFMASAASFDPAEDITAAATKKLEAAKRKGFEGLLASNRAWWKNFWSKAFIHLHSDDGEADLVEQHYTYYLYVMASSSRGLYPTKFNGMLWTTGGDDRKWGNLYWGANQSCLYNALLQSNHPELMDPMFNMYSSGYDTYAKAARQQWDSKGIYIPETTAFDGLSPLPENIAAEMRDLYLLRKPWTDCSKTFNDFAYTKMPFLSRWNWKKDDGWKDGVWRTSDKGGGPFGHVTHIFSCGAKIAYQYWLKYEYTQDQQWLRDKAYPMVKGVAEFYRNFPHVKKEQDGKYHVRHINDNESIWDGHNTTEEIASMMGIFPVAIKASGILKVDPDLRAAWKELAANLSPLPVSTDIAKSSSGKPATWIRSLPPVRQGNAERMPDANTMPSWFFDLCTLESDKKMQAIANATYDLYFPSGINEKTSVYVLSRLASAGAILGRSDATRYLIPNQLRTAEADVMMNRMDMREGFQTTSVQRLGRAAEALQYALCQGAPSAPGEDPVIRVFPAWPVTWDAQYTLACRGGFVVTASMKKGIIEFVEITSNAGAPCRIRNPWPDHEAVVYRNGNRWKEGKTNLLSFTTSKHDRFILVKKGTTLEMFKTTVE